jgi:hypothetical protein
MSARIKWLCANNYGYPPLPLTEQESDASARWQPPQAHQPPLIRTSGPWWTVGAEISRAAEREKQEQRGAYKIDRRLLKKTLNRSMQDRFGKSSTAGHHAVQLGELTVTTNLDFGVRFGQFEYSQGVRTAAFETVLRHGGILTLLGSPQTRWGRLTNDDVPTTADLLVGLCAEFVEAVPEMWARSGLADNPVPNE